MGISDKLIEGAAVESGDQEITIRFKSGTLFALFGLVFLAIGGIALSNFQLRSSLSQLQIVVTTLQKTVESLPPDWLRRDIQRVETELQRQQVQIDRLEGWQTNGYLDRGEKQ